MIVCEFPCQGVTYYAAFRQDKKHVGWGLSEKQAVENLCFLEGCDAEAR